MIKKLVGLIESQATGLLAWLNDLGIGIHTRAPMDYADDYLQKYLCYDDSAMGDRLTELRVKFVQKHINTDDCDLIDVGVGGGAFVMAADVNGYDINPAAVEMLAAMNRYADPYLGCDAITCWDSFEHIPDPPALLEKVHDWVFMSLPIFAGMYDVTESKHYRPGEHLWYFTEAGLIWFMEQHDFYLVDKNDAETRAGRESIMSYAFRRGG